MSSEQQPLLPSYNESQPLYQRARTNASHFLEHPRLHKLIIFLISIDAICVLADLAYSFLSPSCQLPGEDDSPAWLEVLSLISLSVTTAFLIEIPLALWAFGPQYMNPFGPIPHAALHLFDSIIIITTFVLEVILRGKERELAGLLIILRLWRLVKLVGGVAVGAGEMEEETSQELSKTKLELARVKAGMLELQEENNSLRLKLSQFEGHS